MHLLQQLEAHAREQGLNPIPSLGNQITMRMRYMDMGWVLAINTDAAGRRYGLTVAHLTPALAPVQEETQQLLAALNERLIQGAFVLRPRAYEVVFKAGGFCPDGVVSSAEFAAALDYVRGGPARRPRCARCRPRRRDSG